MKKKLAELIEMLCNDASGDEDERYIWRTIKKADSEGNGRRIKIDTETGKIVMGFGAGHTLAEVFKPKSEKIKEKLKKSVIQNRDRSSASSREQIRQISINPDYDRLGTSKTFTDGSPVVAFGKIPAKAYGKETRVVDSEGKKYTVKYAVIEADNLISSHDEQGFVNKEYADTNNLDSVRAIAGNGRTAGIKSAYAKGNADNYKSELLADTDHGVNPEYIKGLKNPVLVRVMNVDDVSADIGDKTNTSNVMSYSNIDRANTDLARIEKVKLETDDNGDLTYNGVKQFVESLPQVEQSQYYNAKGELNKQAQERAYMALFKQAYTNNELFNKAFESLSNRTTLNLMTALKNASPSVANLKGLSDGYDARDLITQGCIKYIKGTENTTASGQADMFLSDTDNQITDTIAKELAMRSRSPGKMERFLVSIARNLRKEAEKQDDMFGQAERFDVKSVVNKSMAVDSCLQTMSAEQREIWNKYGHDYIRELAADSVKPETEGRFFKMLNKMRRNPDLAGLVKAVDIARAYYKGVAFAKGMKTAQGNSLAEDTMEDGFVTLTDKNGNQYVAQCGTEEKERYKKTGKPLSKVNKEKKEAKEKQTEDNSIKQLQDTAKDIKNRLNFEPKEYKHMNNRMLSDRIDEVLGQKYKDLAQRLKRKIEVTNPTSVYNKINAVDMGITEYLKDKALSVSDPEVKNFQEEFTDLCKKIKEKSTKVDNYDDAVKVQEELNDGIEKLHDKYKDITSKEIGIGYFYNKDMDKQKLSIRNDVEKFITAEREKEKKDNPFRKYSPSGKFFGENGADRISNKYFFINHKPDDNTVILENVADRLRVTGKGDLIFLTDKNKGYFINEKNMLPVLSYNNDDNSHTLNLAVKLNKDYLKEYTFKKEFDATEGMMPITKGFEQLQEMAEIKDHPANRTSYRNVDSKQVDFYKRQYLQNLYATQQAFRKPAETVSTGGKKNDIEQHLNGWNGKIYRYKDGTKAIFSNNKKIVLTDEQFDYLKDKATN